VVGVRRRPFSHFGHVGDGERGEVGTLAAVVPVGCPVNAGTVFVAEDEAELRRATAPVLFGDLGVSKEMSDLSQSNAEFRTVEKTTTKTIGIHRQKSR